MTRPRQFVALLGTAALLTLSSAFMNAFAQQPMADPERGFAFGDTDLDGKLSRQEFRDLIKNIPRKEAVQKKAGFNQDFVFDRLDQNRDGFLTLAEYRRIIALRQQSQGGMGPFAKGGMGPFAKGGQFAKGAFAKKALQGGLPNPNLNPNSNRPSVKPIADPPITAEQTHFFETKIRPVLVTKCAKCHSAGAEKPKGSLLVDTKEGLRTGGDNGPAVVPGSLDQSLLITAIRYKDESLQMPPKTKLPDEVIADFEAWVKMGAPDPRSGSKTNAKVKATASQADKEKAKAHWAFQPPKAVDAPKVRDESWPKTDIDRFLLAAIEAKGLRPVGDADRATLIRRVTFDLTGLPPTPEEIEAFLADKSPNAFESVVDRLLASPRFGERWGRHWLDVARFAESSGKANMLYPQAWRYRDWVIAAFNTDKPYNRFVEEQIAGDLIPAKTEKERAEHLIGTGFLALGSKTHNTRVRQQFVLDLADEQIDTTSQAFLGLTIACARCHDHKFDPISQRDYYALSGIFQSTQTCYGTLPGVFQNLNPSPLIELEPSAELPSAVPVLPPNRRAGLEQQLAELVKTRDSLTPEENFTAKGFQTRNRLAMLRFRLDSYRPDGTPRSYVMGAKERFEPVDSPLFIRGELDQPSEIVPRGLPGVLTTSSTPPIHRGSGRRELAHWLASPENPLTARVMVNRVWLHLFGRGLVSSPDNFGTAGQTPSHPELLDTLSVNFMKQHWSVKTLIRQMVLSRAYQLASTHDERNDEVDPDNTLLWHMVPKRLEAEALRDALLSLSGKLILEPPVGSAVAVAGEGLSGPFRNFNQESGDLHRAVYATIVRDQLPDWITLFDFADPSFVVGQRSSTSGPAQSLYLMNNGFVIRQSELAADRLLAETEDDAVRIKTAYLRFLGRAPSKQETTRAETFVKEFTPKANTAGNRERAAWTAFCQALVASAEFRYVN